MTASIFLELALIIGVAAVLALIGRIVKQPPIIAYLITGILVGPFAFNVLQSTEVIQTLARMGVAFLLFIVGLNLDFRVLKDVGGISFIAGVGEILIVGIFTFLIAIGIGLAYTPALYLALAFAFSSTVVVVKLLSDKDELNTLHGRIALGILIVEDFVAAIALMVIPVLGTGDGTFAIILIQLAKAILLIAGMFLFARIFFPSTLSIIARNQEVLFLFSVAWALLISILFDSLGFSLEIGALLAGMALASSKYNLEIRGKIKGLRDFFVVLFFVFFGAQLTGPITTELILQASLFSAFILIGKPLIVMSFMRGFGYKKRTNFMAGVSLAQISEFSLIIILLGFTLGIVPQELFSLSILVALITIALSSYSIYFAQPIYKRISSVLGMFDGKKRELGTGKKHEEYQIILFGYNRIGFNLLKAFRKSKQNFVIIDNNPRTILDLSKRGINCIYGDANDAEFLHSLRMSKSKIVMSTIPDLDINLTILNAITNKKVIFIPTSDSIIGTKKLYAAGSDYVIMPHFLGGDYMAHLLTKDNFNKKLLDKEGQKQLHDLNERLMEGHEHPRKDLHGK